MVMENLCSRFRLVILFHAKITIFGLNDEKSVCYVVSYQTFLRVDSDLSCRKSTSLIWVTRNQHKRTSEITINIPVLKPHHQNGCSGCSTIFFEALVNETVLFSSSVTAFTAENRTEFAGAVAAAIWSCRHGCESMLYSTLIDTPQTTNVGALR